MSDLQVNGIDVLDGIVQMPRVGRWTADLRLDSATVPSGSITLASADNTLSLKGAVRRGGEYTEVGHVHLVGGTGGLESEAAPVYFRSVTLQTPLNALLQSLGEALSPTSDATALNTFLPRWTRERGPGGPALARLADAAGVGWRVLDDGTVWLGQDTFADASVGEDEYELLEDRPAEFRVLIATEQIPSKIRPGTTFRDKRVAFVEYRVAVGGTVTTQVWFERNTTNSHPVLGPMQSVIRDTMRETRFHRLYEARVIEQNGDDSLNVMLDDDSLPHMTEVPLRTFAPGISVRVAAGARVQIAFEGGNPSKPAAMLWQADATDLAELRIGANAHTPVAKEGSKIDEHYHTFALGVAYAGPFPVAGFTDNLGTNRTLPIPGAGASAVPISTGTGSPTMKVP